MGAETEGPEEARWHARLGAVLLEDLRGIIALELGAGGCGDSVL